MRELNADTFALVWNHGLRRDVIEGRTDIYILLTYLNRYIENVTINLKTLDAIIITTTKFVKDKK
jgi:hypothetical protein